MCPRVQDVALCSNTVKKCLLVSDWLATPGLMDKTTDPGRFQVRIQRRPELQNRRRLPVHKLHFTFHLHFTAVFIKMC